MLFLVIGLLGLLGMTWLFPVSGLFLSELLGRCGGRAFFGDHAVCRIGSREAVAPEASFSTFLTIGIPVHNDALKLAATLSSVRAALALSTRFAKRSSIVVFCDGCEDSSEAVAREYHAEVMISKTNKGKWNALQTITEHSPASEWLAFVDAGSVWPVEMGVALEALLCRDDLAGVAPSYRHGDRGLMERAYWWLEKHLKTVENGCNGPVALHGATVFYRTNALRRVFEELRGRQWLNDDVVIPLMVRTIEPGRKILYCPELIVTDAAMDPHENLPRELGRRLRIVLGNVQWIRHLLPRVLRANPVAGTLALRRVCRLFWAYWFLLLGIGLLLGLFDVPASRGLLLVTACVAVVHLFRQRLITGSLSRAWDAANASLASPIYILKEKETVAWH